jgi:DNA-binding NarL/FixJ family response regulator
VVPLSGSESVWLLQLAGPADLGDLGLEFAESFAAALGSIVALVALRQHADQQRHVIARLVNGISEVTERAVELADTPRPDSPLRDPAASSSSTASTAARLSPRQREVLDLMVGGLSNAEIAERLVVTLPTVKSHVQAVLRAYGAVNRSDAITRIARADASTAAAPNGRADLSARS